MAIVALIEYEIGALSSSQQRSSHPIQSSSLDPNKLVTSITLGASVYVPFNGKLLFLSNLEDDSESHSEPPRHDDDIAASKDDDEKILDSHNKAQGIELDVFVDDICQLISDKPVYVDMDDNGVPMAKRQFAAGKGLTRSHMTGPRQDAKSFDIELNSKTKSLLRSSRTGGLIDPGQKLDRAVDPLEDIEEDNQDSTGIVIGFDMKAFDDAATSIPDRCDIEKFLELQAARDGTAGPEDDEGKYYDDHPRKSPRITPSLAVAIDDLGRKIPRRQDDDVSVSDALVGGDIYGTKLNLESQYYRPKDAPSRAADAVSISSISSIDSRSRFIMPKNKQSLMARVLNAKLVSNRNLMREDGSLLDDESYLGIKQSIPRHPKYSRVPMASKARITSSDAPQLASMAVSGGAAHVRELSRGTRSRLSRHGLDGVIQDTVGEVTGLLPPGSYHHIPKSFRSVGDEALFDIEVEARDELTLHEISIQFGGYRVGRSDNGQDFQSSYQPKCIYFTYQFYTSNVTRTEVMKLLPSDKGQVHVLVRDDPGSRGETPLTLKYSIDCSSVSPTECYEFATYLAHNVMYVDVWDGKKDLTRSSGY
jgi:hypothetical protein